MPDLTLQGALQVLGDELRESVGRIAKDAALPPSIRQKAVGWARDAAAALLEAGAAKAAGDEPRYQEALREVRLFGDAAKAVAVGEAMLGIAAAEAEARARLAQAFDFGLGLAGKLLIAALV